MCRLAGFSRGGYYRAQRPTPKQSQEDLKIRDVMHRIALEWPAYGSRRMKRELGKRGYSVEVRTGIEKVLAPLDLPASTDDLDSFSLHPDGKRFLTSIAIWPFDIWMLEGFDEPGPKTWLDRLLRR
jgi:hypothetical protein